jgi:hypothetical protein
MIVMLQVPRNQALHHSSIHGTVFRQCCYGLAIAAQLSTFGPIEDGHNLRLGSTIGLDVPLEQGAIKYVSRVLN